MSKQLSKEGKSVTITVSSYFTPKRWEVLRIASSGEWNIVTAIDKDEVNFGFTLTTEKINLSKWKWIRNFQIKMLGRIFKEQSSH